MAIKRAFYWLNINSSPIDGKKIYKKIKYDEKRKSYYLCCLPDNFPDELEEFLTSITNKLDMNPCTEIPKGFKPYKLKGEGLRDMLNNLGYDECKQISGFYAALKQYEEKQERLEEERKQMRNRKYKTYEC